MQQELPHSLLRPSAGDIKYLDHIPGCKMPTYCRAIQMLGCGASLVLSVYENKELGNCSNSGISARYNSVILVMDPSKVNDMMDERHVVLLSFCTPRGIEGLRAVSLANLRQGDWTMNGGAYVSTCDSRMPFPYPIPLHDRVERASVRVPVRRKPQHTVLI